MSGSTCARLASSGKSRLMKSTALKSGEEKASRGGGVDADPVRAYAWWTLAVEKGESQAETNLAKLSATLTPDQTIEGNALAEEIKVKLERQRLGLPTEDKPDTHFMPPMDKNSVSHSFTIRVKDCVRSYQVLQERGADFITPPLARGSETRCFFRDPDGHLFEISEYREP